MIPFNLQVVVTKFDPPRKLNDRAFTVMSPKISLDYKQPTDIPYDLFYVTGYFESDDEQGNTMDFAAQAISALGNNKKRPPIEALVSIAKKAMDGLNRSFQSEALKNDTYFDRDIFGFTDEFTEDDLRLGITTLLDEFYPNGG